MSLLPTPKGCVPLFAAYYEFPAGRPCIEVHYSGLDAAGSGMVKRAIGDRACEALQSHYAGLELPAYDLTILTSPQLDVLLYEGTAEQRHEAIKAVYLAYGATDDQGFSDFVEHLLTALKDGRNIEVIGDEVSIQE